jgi:hypothetical protein
MKQIEFKGQVGDDKCDCLLGCERKMGGCLFTLTVNLDSMGGDPIRRLYDQPKLRTIIEDIEALNQFDSGNQVIRVDFADQEKLARFLEKFL